MTATLAPTANETLMREGYAALGRGDMDTIRKVFAPDCLTHIPGRNALSGDKHGIEELLDYFGQLMVRSEGTFNIELEQVTSNDGFAIGFHHETGRRGAHILDNQLTVAIRIVESRAVECWVFYFDQEQADEFWG